MMNGHLLGVVLISSPDLMGTPLLNRLKASGYTESITLLNPNALAKDDKVKVGRLVAACKERNVNLANALGSMGYSTTSFTA